MILSEGKEEGRRMRVRWRRGGGEKDGMGMTPSLSYVFFSPSQKN